MSRQPKRWHCVAPGHFSTKESHSCADPRNSSTTTLPADLFPSGQVASVFGLSAMAGTLGGFVSVQAVGHLAERFSYSPVFFGVAFSLPLAALCVRLLVIPASRPYQELHT